MCIYYNIYYLLEYISEFLYNNPGARPRPTVGGGGTCTFDVEVSIVPCELKDGGVYRPGVGPVRV